jgi:hypothetical protein
VIPAGALDPIAEPLSYPGIPPNGNAVLVKDTNVLRISPSRSASLGEWRVKVRGTVDRPLDEVLLEREAAPMASRIPVLAVGSNAAPAQVRRKLATPDRPILVPITAVWVRGLSVGVSAHVSKAGYVPATPVPDPSAKSRMWVTWLTAEELAAMDKTEPNYDRMYVPSACSVELISGQKVADCWLYVSRHGFLTERSGKPRKLIDQHGLISGLLVDVPVLTTLAGRSPKEWVNHTRDAGVRDEIRDLFRSEGITQTIDMDAWPGARD